LSPAAQKNHYTNYAAKSWSVALRRALASQMRMIFRYALTSVLIKKYYFFSPWKKARCADLSLNKFKQNLKKILLKTNFLTFIK